MSDQQESGSLPSSQDPLEYWVTGQLAVLQLRGRVFEIAKDLDARVVLLSKLRAAREAPEVSVLLILTDRDILGLAEHNRFWDHELGLRRGSSSRADGVAGVATVDTWREENALAQVTDLIYNFDKTVVTAAAGSVVGAFLGGMLAADYRIVSDDTVFSFPHLKYQMAPQGALAYFLPQFVGLPRAERMLIGGEAIRAAKALELGLVDIVVPTDRYAPESMDMAMNKCTVSSKVVRLVKKLTRSGCSDLSSFLQHEAKLISDIE